MISIKKDKSKLLYILDAGAGDGLLSISAVIKCIKLGYKNIHVTLYEIDNELIENLNSNFSDLINHKLLKNINLTFEIICKDFIVERPDLKIPNLKYDICIINPPYFKYNVKTSCYAKKTADLFNGDPNIYASFMAVCLNLLVKNGQLISITPRSFTNGLYFKNFRDYILNNSHLEEIHIFGSRGNLFKNSKVLQETIICSFLKQGQKNRIKITSSDTDEDFKQENKRIYPTNLIINTADGHKIISIPENNNDADILTQALKLENTFTKSGYFISTGPIVEHRTKDYIVNNSNKGIPLFRSHNISFMEAKWDIINDKNVSIIQNENTNKVLLENCIYVLLKRFSSKEEKKRLVAGVYEPIKNYKLIGFGNMVNYIGVKNSTLDKVEALGISAVLNSTFMDNYFRCSSGSTQVNATDIRNMKFPDRITIKKIGLELMNMSFSQEFIDKIVMKYLFYKEDI
ncbi:Eco57I restriction-modification methylase domain-containing protein [Aliarcobacter butzleri]